MTRDFTLDDFRRQLDQLEKLDAAEHLRHLPGMSEMMPEGAEPNEALQRIRQMIDAMTDEERTNPDLITSSSISRIAADSGTEPHEVEAFLAQFRQLRALLLRVATMGFWQRLKLLLGFGKFPDLNEPDDPTDRPRE
jgi:signal recognition particle subunit SRP54